MFPAAGPARARSRDIRSRMTDVLPYRGSYMSSHHVMPHRAAYPARPPTRPRAGPRDGIALSTVDHCEAPGHGLHIQDPWIA